MSDVREEIKEQINIRGLSKWKHKPTDNELGWMYAMRFRERTNNNEREWKAHAKRHKEAMSREFEARRTRTPIIKRDEQRVN